MKYFKKLIGDRIYLAPRNIEDAELYAKWLNDFNTTDYTGRSYGIVTYEAEREYLENPKEDAYGFGIVTLDNDKLIGTVSLEKVDLVNRAATLGIFIGDEEYRGNGYGTEAIRLILDFAFNYVNLNNVKLDLMAFNDRAYKCYLKCGFKEYGRRRKCKYINGKYYDTICMDILAEEFKETYIKNKNIK